MKQVVSVKMTPVYNAIVLGILAALQGVDCGITRNAKDFEGIWLSDMIDYDYMGDEPAAGNDYCPPVPSVLPSGSCSRKPCSSDRTCADHDGKCCYNGCIYTCLYQVGPPGYFDWPKEPRRLRSSGRSWLVDSPESMIEAEPCSTSPVEEDEDPLLCPRGYVCSVEDPGNVKQGIPNSGKCVLEKDKKRSKDEDTPTVLPLLLDPELEEAMRKEKVCEETKGMLILEGAIVRRKGRNCKCHKGKLFCRRRRSRGRKVN